MKIRTITLGISGHPTADLIRWAGKQLERAADHFTSQGYLVQTRRIALAHWDSGIGLLAEAERTELLQMVDSVCAESGIDFCSVGIIRVPSQIDYMAHRLVDAPRLNASADAGYITRGLDSAAISAAAKAIRYLASNTAGGIGNFRFGAGFCLEPGNPFFPGSYHFEDRPAFTIGFENSDILVEAFTGSGNLVAAREKLFSLLQANYQAVEESANHLAEATGLAFAGLDTSIAPSLMPHESVVEAFRALNIEFGARGTLAACGVVTDVVKNLSVKRIGYCGIMLPILEDVGLAQVTSKGRLGITDLLTYASVCGVGVDMVPIPGQVALQQLEALMFDVGTMALRLKKPLSVRVLPIPGKHVGERTQFASPYLCNSRVIAL